MLKMFESRNRKLSNLIQLGDFLGYAIRENIQLFSVNSLEDKVTYLTEKSIDLWQLLYQEQFLYY